MKRARHLHSAALAAAAAFLLLASSRAHAAPGLALAWNHCLGEGTGVQNVNFACDTNTGSRTIVASMVLPGDMPGTTGIDVNIHLASESDVLPPWWEFRFGGACRVSAMGVNMIADPANQVCVDWSGGVAAGGNVAYCTSSQPCPNPGRSPNTARLHAITLVAQELAMDLTGGTEYFLFNIVINNSKTIGAGNCGGCEVPVCIIFNDAYVQEITAQHNFTLDTPSSPGSNFVTWQGGGVPVVGGKIGCPAATPTQRSTWGSVKSLYR